MGEVNGKSKPFVCSHKRRPIWKIISLLAIQKLCKEYVFRLLLCLLFPSFLTNCALCCIFHSFQPISPFFQVIFTSLCFNFQTKGRPSNKCQTDIYQTLTLVALKVESWFGIKKLCVCCSFGLITQPSRACLAIPQIRLRPVHRPNISPAYEYS